MSVKIESVTYPNLAWQSAGNLIFPPDFDKSKKYPALLAAHPIGSCKEQTAGNVYGVGLAKAGFVVLAFDASFQGQSGGEPRFIEDPGLRVGDFRFAVDFLVTLPYVDEERIGALGVCGAGGYVINATMTEHRIKAVTSITAVNFGRLTREAFTQFEPAKAMEAMGKQRTAEARGAERNVIDLIPLSNEAAKAEGATDPDIVQATDYYRSRCPDKNGPAKQLFSFNAAATTWDAFNHIETLLTQPAMMIVGDIPGAFGGYRDSLEAYGRASGSKDRQLVVLPNTSHYQLYDQPEATGAALAKAIPFFEKHLA
ncbi:hypothetical protein CcaverHIS002_0200010 [Cutaneotrichosporon cavernicola]|uniref:Alpha/beta-hydrolase n=1 Tax=Cutaneotrichosporon cavernicola TaxID=279322 RepID=A0AA48HZX8_9TREE|nr:uncharacterized protein CcaverHIS019_0200060 [Cutaneotrichosporon cavernicola]BEI80841.1 hypothetical protein CcaverHIS002_0200010 [Cutaneotrichosporon cavernicola]BEI88644.1 hypothetical protein CcaverHIS019_0200060 [Cutaneotrichosporon cavernicola]BEI96417.1 hypothetical protein CcaverHIS631_0200060 [Cutaneotrichosporon cavernicola]BEJ04189.1 hypothetical protein CcaverHIS641_0200060 [Cutaneotrichosporon cavernicola]